MLWANGHKLTQAGETVNRARRTSKWYDGMLMVTIATDLPHEIEAK